MAPRGVLATTISALAVSLVGLVVETLLDRAVPPGVEERHRLRPLRLAAEIASVPLYLAWIAGWAVFGRRSSRRR